MKNTHDPNEPRQSKRSAGRSSAGGRRRTISSGASASQGGSPLDSARTNAAVPGHAGVHDRAGRVDTGRKVSSGDNHSSNHNGNHADAEQSTQDGFASAQPPISGRPVVAELGRGLIAGLLGWFLPSFFLSLLCGICTLLFSVESTTSLTGAIMPLATASVLLSQGVGVRYADIVCEFRSRMDRARLLGVRQVCADTRRFLAHRCREVRPHGPCMLRNGTGQRSDSSRVAQNPDAYFAAVGPHLGFIVSDGARIPHPHGCHRFHNRGCVGVPGLRCHAHRRFVPRNGQCDVLVHLRHHIAVAA